MNSTNTVGMALRPMADTFTFMTSPVHPVYFPYAWASTLHALRISMIYQANVRTKLNWRTYMAGYFLMCWGGMLSCHWLMGTTPPVLYSIHPYINYGSVHLLLTLLFQWFPDLKNVNPWLIFPLDAILRTVAITVSLAPLSLPTTDERLAASPLFHVLIGAAASSGGGVLAVTLNTWSPNWALSTPAFLRDGVGLWGTLDVWAGGIIAVIYGSMTAHPAFPAGPFTLSPLGARALGGYVMMILFGLRVWSTPRPQKNVQNVKKTQ